MTLIKRNLNFIKKLAQFRILSTLEFQFILITRTKTFNFFEVFIHFSSILNPNLGLSCLLLGDSNHTTKNKLMQTFIIMGSNSGKYFASKELDAGCMGR